MLLEQRSIVFPFELEKAAKDFSLALLAQHQKQTITMSFKYQHKAQS